jgi:hypothetical protein
MNLRYRAKLKKHVKFLAVYESETCVKSSCLIYFEKEVVLIANDLTHTIYLYHSVQFCEHSFEK